MRAASSLFAAVLLAAASAVPAADLTWPYTANLSTTNGLTYDEITVTPTYKWADTAYFGMSSGLLQIGKKNQNVVSVTYAFSAFPSRVKSIAVTGKTASGNSGETMVSATIGDADFTGSASLTNGVGIVLLLAPDGPQTGTVSLRIDNPKGDSNNGSSQAVYLSSIDVTYEDPNPADPWKPEWSIGAPSSNPTVGKAFSFGVSAALADGTPQTVSFGVLTPAATGAQPTFANGVFSWTPGADAAGNYAAAFSVQNAGGTYTTNVAFSVRGATEETTLFFETFSKCTGNWGATSPGAFSSSYSDSNYVWSVTSAKRGYSGMRLGNKTTYDAAVTPTIRPMNDAACTVVLSFVAAGWDAGDRMTVSVPAASWTQEIVLSNAVDTAASTPLPTGEGYSFGPYEISVPGPFTVSFQRASGDGRMGIDSVKVTQKVSTSLVDLAVPTGLAVVGGTLSTNSFSVAWNSVANATNYAAEVYAPGGTAPVRSVAPASTSAFFSGLADDTDYEVRVRAEGDTALYNFSDWTNISVRTLRSAIHPTLSVGAWKNAANAPGEHKLYGVIGNVAAVSAELDDHTPVEVALARVQPVPSSSPTLENETLSWTPDAADEGTTFTLTFEMTPAPGVVYETNLSFKVQSLPELRAPVVTVSKPVAWNAIDLSWDVQYRAAGYGVRAWTDCPNPAATTTRVEENFVGFFRGSRPAGWVFEIGGGYDKIATPVKFDEDNQWMATYDLGGSITSVVFTVQGNTMKNGSTLRAYWAGELTDVELADKDNWTNNLVAAVSDLVSQARTVMVAIPAGSNARRIVWQYEKKDGNVGVGSVVIEGSGFPTPRWLPGWGPAVKDVGLVQGCTVKKPRPGTFLGVDPADQKKDLTVPRTNYAEVTVRDAAGTTFATVVEVDVPAPPRSVRASMMILR